jgi:hypothetical protein
VCFFFVVEGVYIQQGRKRTSEHHPRGMGGGGAPPPSSNRGHRNRLRCTCRRSRRSYALNLAQMRLGGLGTSGGRPRGHGPACGPLGHPRWPGGGRTLAPVFLSTAAARGGQTGGLAGADHLPSNPRLVLPTAPQIGRGGRTMAGSQN